MRRSIAALAAVVALCRVAPAQEIRGSVLDSAGRQPVPGAVLMLLDSAGTILGRNITNERGQFRMSVAGAGQATRTVRVVRIGFRPRTVVVAAPAIGNLDLEIPLAALPTLLVPMRVLDQPTCPQRDDRGAALALWEQAQTALLATVVSRESNPAAMLRVVYGRRLAGNTDRVEHQTVRVDSTDRSTKSFYAVRSAAEFVRLGFRDSQVRPAAYFGPDAEVLLDDDFLAGYCIRLAAPNADRANDVGLAFEPASRAGDRIDIGGTVWIDTAARALRDVEFRYVGLERRFAALRPGGHMEFREMPNGLVLLSHWDLRVVGADYARVFSPRGFISSTRVDPYTEEGGGELARARWPDGKTWLGSLGTLRVHTVTRNGAPAAGTMVVLDDTEYRGSADANGDLEIPHLIPGPYSLRIGDRRFAAIDLTMPANRSFVAQRGAAHEATVVVPGAGDVVADRCASEGKVAPPGDSTWLLLRVMTPYGTPVSGIKVSLRQQEETGSWVQVRDDYQTGDDGLFALCRGLRPRANVIVQIHVGFEQEDLLIRLNAGLTVVRVPFRTTAKQ